MRRREERSTEKGGVVLAEPPENPVVKAVNAEVAVDETVPGPEKVA